jgi:2,3-bisphosphoglycerate-independent phosphoglycerate mutase
MRSVLIIFLDGVGLGDEDPQVNPFMQADLPFLQSLLNVKSLVRRTAGTSSPYAHLLGVDAVLGVPGLPQSATGQTAILTGLNAPEILGEHSGPYPNRRLKELLAKQSLFLDLAGNGRPVAYANAYPTLFHDRLLRGKGRLSANTLAATLAGIRLRTADDLRAGAAINALLTNEFWPEAEATASFPSISAYQAGQNLGQLALTHSLTFFEFWYSDYLGHKMIREESVTMLERLDRFLAGTFETMNGHESLLVVISDHGNFEDWTTKKHTANPALAIVAGDKFATFSAGLQALTDINPMVLTYLEANR